MNTVNAYMTKREEYKLKFYKEINKFGTAVYICDTHDAPGEKKQLSFIDALDPAEVAGLIDVITDMQNNQPFDPNFLEDSEIFDVYVVTYSNPNFWVGTIQTIHRDDLKTVLQEWLTFRNE